MVIARVMAVDKVFRLILVVSQCVLALGTLIDPQSLGPNAGMIVHCLTSNNVIQIKDPFNKSLKDEIKFFAMEWYRYTENGTKETQVLSFQDSDPAPSIHVPNFSIFEFWGLQINNVDHRDSAKYIAKLVNLAGNMELSLQIDVASPPALASARLTLTRTVSETGQSVTLSCGRVAHLGSPPISIILKADNGTELPTVYQNGFFQLTLTSKEAESGKFTCEINSSSSAARCIDSKDLPRWQGAVTGQVTSASSDMTWIIVGTVIGVVLLVVIVVVVVIVLRRRRKASTYNAKGQEKKRDNNFNENKSALLLRDDENHYQRPSTKKGPIYKGPSSPGPYLVSNISQGDDDDPNYHDPNYHDPNYHDPNYHGSSHHDPNYYDPDLEYEEMEIGNGARTPPRSSSSSFFKKREEKDKGKSEKSNGRDGTKGKDGQKPPRAKPRSIFLTPSMEELDKISKAVAGGEGSGAGVIGTQV